MRASTYKLWGCHSYSLLFVLNVNMSVRRNINVLLFIITKKSKQCGCLQTGDCMADLPAGAVEQEQGCNGSKQVQDQAGLQSVLR